MVLEWSYGPITPVTNFYVVISWRLSSYSLVAVLMFCSAKILVTNHCLGCWRWRFELVGDQDEITLYCYDLLNNGISQLQSKYPLMGFWSSIDHTWKKKGPEDLFKNNSKTSVFNIKFPRIFAVSTYGVVSSLKNWVSEL